MYAADGNSFRQCSKCQCSRPFGISSTFEIFWLAFVGKRIGDRETLELAYRMATDTEATVQRMRGNRHRVPSVSIV